MNRQRRKALAEALAKMNEARDALMVAIELLEPVAEEEREAFENRPDALKEGEAGEKASEIADALDEAKDSTQCALDELEGALDKLEGLES